MLLDPSDRSGLKSGRDRTPTRFDQSLFANKASQQVCFSATPSVFPDDGWAQRRAIGIEENTAVHLARQTDRFDRCSRSRCNRALHRQNRCGPPRFRVLLSPTRGWSRNGIANCSPSENIAVLRDDQHLDRTGTKIDCQNAFLPLVLRVLHCELVLLGMATVR